MLQGVTECYRVIQTVTECYRLLQSVTGCNRVLQSVTECYRVFLAHLLRPVFGLVRLATPISVPKRNTVFSQPELVFHERENVDLSFHSKL